MSILDNNNAPQDISIQISNRIINQTKQTFNSMANAFNEGAKIFWQNPRGASPQQIASALGTNAKEVFELHYALGVFISGIKPEAIQEGLSVIGQFTINQDGTVTVIEQQTT